jgi:hypothetical protein
MNTQLQTLYRNSLDFITFVKLEAPDFAPGDNLTCETAISRVRKYLADIRAAEKNEVASRWLKLSGQEVDKAENFFAEKRNSDGRRALDSARTHLMNASIRKAMDATFIAGETGGTQDLGSGFPS